MRLECGWSRNRVMPKWRVRALWCLLGGSGTSPNGVTLQPISPQVARLSNFSRCVVKMRLCLGLKEAPHPDRVSCFCSWGPSINRRQGSSTHLALSMRSFQKGQPFALLKALAATVPPPHSESETLPSGSGCLAYLVAGMPCSLPLPCPDTNRGFQAWQQCRLASLGSSLLPTVWLPWQHPLLSCHSGGADTGSFSPNGEGKKPFKTFILICKLGWGDVYPKPKARVKNICSSSAGQSFP